MSGRHCDERGQVIVLGAVMIPVLLLLAALVVDVGNWYTHKRQLQNRADAAAFAAAVEYGKNWKACVQTADPTLKGNSAQKIANAARQYAGDPDAADYNKPTTSPAGQPPASVYNSEIANQTHVDVAINSTSYDDNTDYSGDDAPTDGVNVGDPCYLHTVGDDISAPGYWTDVKAQERDLPSLFGGVGLPLSRNGARARVEIRPALSGHRFLPLAIPDNVVTAVQVRYIDQCTGDEILKQDLAPLSKGDFDAYQSGGGGSLWAVPDAGNPKIGDKNHSVGLPITAYDPADCGSLQYRPIGEQVRVASSPDVKLDDHTCDELKSLSFADCFMRLSQIRIWAGSSAIPEPRVHDVHVLGGCPSPGDGYFGTLPLEQTKCPYGVSVAVDWGERDDGNKKVDANFTVSANGTKLALQSWDTASEAIYASPATAFMANAGGTDISISLAWYDDGGPTHVWDGKPCVDPPGSAKSPCVWKTFGTPSSEIAHRTFVGVNSLNTNPGDPSNYDPNATGAVESVHTSLAPIDSSGAVGPSFDNWHPSSAGGAPCISPCAIYPTVGVRSALASGTLTVLRTDDPQGSQLVDCDPAVSAPLTLFKYGCQPWYGGNDFTDKDWWDPSKWATGCPTPPKNTFFKTNAPAPYTNSANNPWRCVVNQGGIKAGQAGDWMFVATDNCKKDNGLQCQTQKKMSDTDVHCGNYDGTPALPGRPADPNGWVQRGGPSNDPRVVSLFVVPYQSLKNVGGSGSGSPIPVLRFASFYVMNWLGGPSGKEDDPCPDPDFKGTNIKVPASKAGLIGVFDTTVEFEPGPVDPNAICKEDDPTPCRAVLVR